MKIEVHLQGGLRKVIDITPGATVGAVVGVNLRNPDGTLWVPPSSGGQPPVSVTSWELILNIPPNVTALAKTVTTGLYVVTGSGASATRTITPVSGETTVANGDGVSGNPTVGLADVTPSPGGSIQRLGFDSKGRRSEVDTATTDNLSEGVTNLYFTDARAQAAVGPVRERLLADRNYYVSTTGNDSNNGLSPGTPFLTIQKAANTILSSIDTNGFRVIINIADGTYTAGFSATSRTIGGSSIEIIGNTTTPANVVIAAASGNCINANFGALCQISGMTLSASAGSAIVAGAGATVFVLSSVVFGACSGDHALADSAGRVQFLSNYSVSGGCVNHWHATNTGNVSASGITITVTGTPTMNRWAGAAGAAVINAPSNTYVGSMTGDKFLVHRVALINTEGAGISAFPGSVAGTQVAATGGYYV